MGDAKTRASTGLMAPTHALREHINDYIRTDLKPGGQITGETAVSAPDLPVGHRSNGSIYDRGDPHVHTGRYFVNSQHLRYRQWVAAGQSAAPART